LIFVLLDTNAYLRLAKRVRPAIGIKFGQKDYVLTVHRTTEDLPNYWRDVKHTKFSKIFGKVSRG